MKKRKRNGIKRAVIVLFFILFILGGVGVLFHYRPDWKFRVEDLVTGWFDSVPIEKVEYKQEDLKVIEVSDLERADTLMLVNETYPLEIDYAADLAYYKDTDVVMAKPVMESFSQLAAYVKKETGEKLYIRDAYRNLEEQETVYQEKPDVAAIPGSSEHMTGLALDVYVSQFAGYGFLKSPSGQLVNRDCWQYGFIIRYPQFRETDTKIPFEPWHIRYVGIPHAEIITKNNLILEEYIESLEIGNFYSSCGYIITRQHGDQITIPKEMFDLTVSMDNMGNWIVTGKVKG